MPFVLMAYAALLFRWLNFRIDGATLMACAAGFFDVLGFGLSRSTRRRADMACRRSTACRWFMWRWGWLLLVGAGLLWRMEMAQMKYRPALAAWR